GIGHEKNGSFNKHALCHINGLNMPRNFIRFALLLATPSLALAHGSNDNSSLWNLDPWVLTPLSALTALYIIGLHRIHQRRRDKKLPSGVIYFSAALLCLILALVWPLEVLSGRSFAAHVLQHMLLLSVAAPLLVLARPLPVLLAALPKKSRRTLIL